MGTVLGIAGFTLLWAATCLTEASLAEIVLTGLLGLALMIAGRLWTPCMGWIKERMRRQPMPAGTRAGNGGSALTPRRVVRSAGEKKSAVGAATPAGAKDNSSPSV